MKPFAWGGVDERGVPEEFDDERWNAIERWEEKDGEADKKKDE